MAKGDDIQDRLIAFAVRIIHLIPKLPKNMVGSHISKQMMRSGTSAAANYGEARSAESRRDFVHKLKVALKELNETNIWLQIIVKSSLLSGDELEKTIAECGSISRIQNASIQTATGKR